MTFLLAFLGTVALGTVRLVAGSYVFVQLWAWLVASQFGFAPAPLAHVIGAAFVVNFVARHFTPQTRDTRPIMEQFGSVALRQTLDIVLGCPITLAFGWCWHRVLQ